MEGMGMTGRPMGIGGMGGMGGGMGGMGGGMGGMGGGMGGMGGGMGGMRIDPMGGAFDGQDRGNGRAVEPAPRRDSGGTHNSGSADENSGAASAPMGGIASSGKEAIDLAQRLAEMKAGTRADTSAQRAVAGRLFRRVREAWVDQAFKPSTPTLRLRVLGKAYFRILAQHPSLGPIFALGHQVTWVSPSGTALVIANQGQDDVTDATLDRLFARPK